jgi:hypothetical protein
MKRYIIFIGLVGTCLFFACKKSDNIDNAHSTLKGRWYWDTVTTHNYINNATDYSSSSIVAFSGTTGEGFEFKNDGTVFIINDPINPGTTYQYTYDEKAKTIIMNLNPRPISYSIIDMTASRLVLTYDYTFIDGSDIKRATGRFICKTRN